VTYSTSRSSGGCTSLAGVGRCSPGEPFLDTDSGYVFTNEDGAAIDPLAVSKCFQRLITFAGVRAIRLHDARRSYATAALRAGIPAKVVSERLGHKSIAITLDTYSHVLPQADEEAAETVERLILGE
jgi:integrase